MLPITASLAQYPVLGIQYPVLGIQYPILGSSVALWVHTHMTKDVCCHVSYGLTLLFVLTRSGLFQVVGLDKRPALELYDEQALQLLTHRATHQATGIERLGLGT